MGRLETSIAEVMADQLAELGYRYIPGPSGNSSELVLRKVDDATQGFEWKGQEDYDKVGAAAMAFMREALVRHCGLEAICLDVDGTAYASPRLSEHTGPVLLLVCGSAPGGDVGVWGRSLCINASTLEGAMFDYVARAKALGWAVVIAGVHGNQRGPSAHMSRLWQDVLAPSPSTKLLVVAHSAGAAWTVEVLAHYPEAAEKLEALVLTDGAFPPLAGEGANAILRVTRNFVASNDPPGTPLQAAQHGWPTAVSAGHTAHPSTTHAATEPVFEFLGAGAKGEAANANEELQSKF